MKPEAIFEGAAAAHHQSLHGRVALVTGSTSGIGLGIARAFCAQGMNVVLNGFGGAGEIERLRAELAEEFAVDVRCRCGRHIESRSHRRDDRDRR